MTDLAKQTGVKREAFYRALAFVSGRHPGQASGSERDPGPTAEL